MKKILIYLLSFIIIIFIIPALLTKRTTTTSSKEEKNNQLQTIKQEEKQTIETETSSKYNYNKYGTITLLHKKTGAIEQVNLDDYLCNVVSAEMPATFEQEALKAQAIVARTYTIYKILNKKHDNADICDA